MPKPKFLKRTNKQNSILHSLLGKHGFSSDDKADMVHDITRGRTEHTSEMSVDEANWMIARLGGYKKAEPVQDRSRRTVQLDRQIAGVQQIITPTMKDFIHTLQRRREMTDEGLTAICRRMIKKDFPTTNTEGNKIVEALKAMIKRDQTFDLKKDGGKAA